MFRKKRKKKIARTEAKYRRKRSQKKLTFHNSPHKRPQNRFKKNNPSFVKFRRRFYLIGSLSIFSLFIYWLYFSAYFQIDLIEGKSNALDSEIINRKIETALEDQVGENIFKIDKRNINNDLKSQIREIESLKIETDLPNKLIVEYEEYPLAANIIVENQDLKKSYIVNTIGYIIKEDVESNSLPYVKLIMDNEVNLDKALLEEDKLNYILGAITDYEERFGMRVIEATYKPLVREVHIRTEKEFIIWLDIQNPYQDQFKKLKKVKNKLDIYNEAIAYIDLRISGKSGNKLIYKMK